MTFIRNYLGRNMFFPAKEEIGYKNFSRLRRMNDTTSHFIFDFFIAVTIIVSTWLLFPTLTHADREQLQPVTTYY